jgi:ATP-dependent helicase HrpB
VQGLDRLPWTKAQKQVRDRINFLRAAYGAGADNPWPDLTDKALAETVGDWLAPALLGHVSLAEIDAEAMQVALDHLVPWPVKRRMEEQMPSHFEAPTGSRIAIDYAGAEGPVLAIRVQELFGLTTHPAIAGGRVPLVLHLLSPAHRPIQITRDLPGFWRGSWAAVRAEMKGRYPRHPWPEDPASAAPTTRAKPRGP